MPQRRTKGAKLKVFSGREARLNRVILLIYRSNKLLAKYDALLEIRKIKGFKHEDSKTVYRRIEALNKEGFLSKQGFKKTQPGWESSLYELTLKGKAALKLDEKNLEEFLLKATDEQLLKLMDALS